jgi:twinkle protein
MKIVSLITKEIYEITASRNGENYMPCPECSKHRKHQKAKCFSWNNEKMAGKCHNCDASFVIHNPSEKEKEFTAPVWKNKTGLTEGAAKWFEGRMISQKVLNDMKVYSDVEYMPQLLKETTVICFPFFKDGNLVNIKYRTGNKEFKLVSGAELILYNIDSIKDSNEVIFVEGEIDCLSYISVGFKNVVSVPNGASSKLDFLDKCFELFETKEKIYLATDNDSPGITLRDELLRRFGNEKCLIVNFKDCKDANEYLVKKGGIALKETIKDAIELPVKGIVNLSIQYDSIYNLYINGMQKAATIDISELDNIVSWELGRLAIVTGIPSHGKSEFVDFVVTKLNVIQGWKAAYFSPENFPIMYHFSKLCSKITGHEFNAGYLKLPDFQEAFEYIKENFFFIYPEDDMSFISIIDKAKYLVKKRGIKILVIDPYNKIEHLKEKGENETEYISRLLDKLVTFSRTYNVLVFLVAHPRKMQKDVTGKYEAPNLYDINGSANFYNKCDYGISIYRMRNENEVHIHVLKVKFKHLGDGGTIQMKYNYRNGRYERFESDVNQWDNSNYLLHKAIEAQSEESFQAIIDKTDIPF